MRRLLILFVAFIGLSQLAHAQTIGCCGNLPGGTTYLGQVATRSIINDAGASATVMSRAAHFFPASQTSFQIVMQNFNITLNNNEGSADGTIGVFTSHSARASIEYPVGTCTQVTWGGQSTVTTSNALYPISDPISVSIPANTKFFERIYSFSAAGNSTSVNVFTAGATGAGGTNTAIGDQFDAGVGTPDQTTSCDAITGNHGQGSLGILTSAAIVANTTAPSACLIGDSIQQGFLAGQNTVGDMGVMAMTIGPKYGYIMMGIGGTQAGQYVNFNLVNGRYVSNSTVRQSLYKYCSHMGDNYGTNDIINGQSATNLESYELQIWYGQQASSLGGVPISGTIGFNGPIFHTTLTPQVTATQVATPGGQSVLSTEAQRVAFNTWLRQSSNGPNGSYFDIEAQLSTLSSGNIVWKDGATFSAQCCSTTPYWVALTGSSPFGAIHPTLAADEYLATTGIIALSRIAR
jgi:hypothetical protein